jgi:hypothetical protein
MRKTRWWQRLRWLIIRSLGGSMMTFELDDGYRRTYFQMPEGGLSVGDGSNIRESVRAAIFYAGIKVAQE